MNHSLAQALEMLGGAPAPAAPPALKIVAPPMPSEPPPEPAVESLLGLAVGEDEKAGTDWLIYVDCSGSMLGAKIRKASSTVGALFKNKLGSKDRIEFSSFTEGHKVLVPLAHQADIPVTVFKGARESLRAEGGTWLYSCIVAAFERAAEIAAADAATDGSLAAGGGGGGGGGGGSPSAQPPNKRIIVLTDGMDCAGGISKSFADAAAAIAARGGAARARIYFAAVGAEAEHEKLRELSAGHSHTKVLLCSDARAIPAAFSGLVHHAGDVSPPAGGWGHPVAGFQHVESGGASPGWENTSPAVSAPESPAPGSPPPEGVTPMPTSYAAYVAGAAAAVVSRAAAVLSGRVQRSSCASCNQAILPSASFCSACGARVN